LNEKKKYIQKNGKTTKEILGLVEERFGRIQVEDPHEALLKQKATEDG
jgi:hypothetical protein